MFIEQKQDRIFKPTSIYTLSAEETNQQNTELQGLITHAGLVPSDQDLTQVAQAIDALIAAATPVATTSTVGLVKPDNMTISIAADGTISASGGSGSGKSIGEVYFSESSSAADNPGGLPLFTGETIATADELYPDFYTWVADHADLQISAADYETALATYGECPKYVIDTVNKTIRLPKLVNYVKMANTTDKVTQAAAGLPNITGTIQQQNWQTTTTGAIASTGALTGNNVSNTANTGGSGTGVGTLSIDASLSNSIYGNANTVTPAHTTLYPWVFAFNSAVAASVAQAAEFQTALTGKADVGLGNLTDAGEIKVAHLAMPGNEYDDLTLGASGASYSAPADGYVCIRKLSSGSNQTLSLYSLTNGMQQSVSSTGSSKELALIMPCKKGDSFGIYYELGGATQLFRFIYAKGADSEAA